MQCPNCGNQVTPGEAFCDNCGAALTPAQSNPPAVGSTGALDASAGQGGGAMVTPAPPQAPKLVIDSDGTAFDLAPGKALLIGRLDPIDGIYPEIDLTPHDRECWGVAPPCAGA